MAVNADKNATKALLESRSLKSRDSYGTISTDQEGDGSECYSNHDTSRKPICRSHPTHSAFWKRHLRNAIWFVCDQYFLFGLGFFILLASQVQVPRAQQALKETVVTYLCVSVIFFITGCTLPTTILLQNYSRWRLHLFCQVQSFLLTSAIVFGVVSACASNVNFMDAGLLVGLLFTGCVPTTISSNVVMTAQASGNQALTVVESTLGNLLGPFIAPLLILMYLSCDAWYTKTVPTIELGDFGGLYRRVFMQLGLSIFLPLVSRPQSVHMRSPLIVS